MTFSLNHHVEAKTGGKDDDEDEDDEDEDDEDEDEDVKGEADDVTVRNDKVNAE